MRTQKALMMTVGALLVATACVGTKPGGNGDCPPPRQSNEICPQVVAWAKDPQNGTCCQYGTACNAPEGWKTYNTEAECQAGS